MFSIRGLLNKILKTADVDAKKRDMQIAKERSRLSKFQAFFFDRAHAGKPKISKLSRKLMRRNIHMYFWTKRIKDWKLT